MSGVQTPIVASATSALFAVHRRWGRGDSSTSSMVLGIVLFFLDLLLSFRANKSCFWEHVTLKWCEVIQLVLGITGMLS